MKICLYWDILLLTPDSYKGSTSLEEKKERWELHWWNKIIHTNGEHDQCIAWTPQIPMLDSNPYKVLKTYIQGESVCEKKSKIIWNAWKDVLFNALKVWKGGFMKSKNVWNHIKICTYFNDMPYKTLYFFVITEPNRGGGGVNKMPIISYGFIILKQINSFTILKVYWCRKSAWNFWGDKWYRGKIQHSTAGQREATLGNEISRKWAKMCLSCTLTSMQYHYILI